MTEYKVVDGIASTPKGQQLYDQAVAQQNARSLTNLGHRVQLSTSAKKNIAGVSNRPKTAPRAFQWYATRQDLIERGFPVVDGLVTPVTKAQAQQQGYADSPDYRSSGKGDYLRFFNVTYNNYSRQTTQDVLNRQAIYRQITGNPTFAYHGCNGHECPQWNRNSGILTSNVKHYGSRKINNAPVETSKTMYQGLSRTAYHLQPDLVAPKPEEIIPLPIEPEIIEETQTTDYPIAIIMGILAVVIIIILRGKKNA